MPQDPDEDRAPSIVRAQQGRHPLLQDWEGRSIRNGKLGRAEK